jgi:C4-dicarboxylate-specific signal transduction histidine kinase
MVRTARDGEQVIVSVEDRGPGFPADVADVATEPLVSGKAGVRGAGMGLAIVGAFVGAVNGSMTAERHDDRTVVTLRLPAS